MVVLGKSPFVPYVPQLPHDKCYKEFLGLGPITLVLNS